MTASARNPLPDAQLDALLRDVLGAPTLSAAQRQRHLRQLLPASPPPCPVGRSAVRIETDAARARPVPAPAHAAPPRRPGWLRQGLGFAGSLLALALVAGLLMAVFGVAGDGDKSRRATGSLAGPRELIVPWDANGDSAYKLFSVNPDGGERQPRKLIPGPAAGDPAREAAAAISPDGKRVAYVSDRDGTPALYVLDGNPVKVADGPLSFDAPPVWSPDGARLLITTPGPPGYAGNIAVVNTDGSGRQALTRLSAGAIWPSWSPDGARIAYVSMQGTGLAIWVMNADGSNARAITDTPSPDMSYQWSPDGRRIVYTTSSGSLYVVGAEGQDSRLLREGGAWGPRWSPDGSQIAFIGGDAITDTRDVFVMRADGSDVRKITRHAGALTHLAWSPDGAWIAYVIGPRGGLATPASGPWELRVVGADGADDSSVLRDVDPLATPAWRTVAPPDNTPAPPTPTSAALTTTANVRLYAVSLGYADDGSYGGRLTAFATATRRQLYALNISQNADAVLLPDGTRLYTVVNDAAAGESLVGLDATTGQELWRTPIKNRMNWIMGLGPSAFAVSRDGKQLYVLSYDSQGTASRGNWTQVFDTSNGAKLEEFDAPGCPAQMRVSPDGRTLYFVCTERGYTYYVDLSDAARPLRPFSSNGLITGVAISSATSADGRWLYIVDDAPRVTVIDADARSIVQQAGLDADGAVPPRLLSLVALSPDGQRLFVGARASLAGGEGADNLATFDTATWQRVGMAALDPQLNGQTLAATADNRAVYGAVNAYQPNTSISTTATIMRLAPDADATTLATLDRQEILRLFVGPGFASDAQAPTATPSAQPPTGELAFASGRDGNDELYAINADGSGLRRLTNDPAPDANPVWSPDGTRIAFTRGADGARDVWVMDAGGANARDLTNLPGDELQPAWSPDGQTIAFAYGNPAADVRFQIYAVGLDGAPPRNLSNRPGTDDETPAWSPDGAAIAFSRQGLPSPQIWLMDVDGANQRALTSNSDTANPDVALLPRWSPNGRQIVYQLLNETWQAYTIDADGSGQRPLAPDGADEEDAGWSPDGSRIVLKRQRGDGRISLVVAAADGSERRDITAPTADINVVRWSPDGRWLAYVDQVTDGGQRRLSLVGADGSGSAVLAEGVLPYGGLAWRPSTP